MGKKEIKKDSLLSWRKILNYLSCIIKISGLWNGKKSLLTKPGNKEFLYVKEVPRGKKNILFLKNEGDVYAYPACLFEHS